MAHNLAKNRFLLLFWDLWKKFAMHYPRLSYWISQWNWAGLMLAGVAMEEAHEYAIAMFLLIAGAVSVAFAAFHWQGIKDYPILTKVSRIIIFLFGVTLFIVSPIWIFNVKVNNPWSRLHLSIEKAHEDAKQEVAKPPEKPKQSEPTFKELSPSPPSSQIIMQTPMGNLKQRATDLSKEIIEELNKKGEFSPEVKFMNFGSYPIPDKAKDRREWTLLKTSHFKMRFLKKVLDIQKEFAQLHLQDELLNESLESIKQRSDDFPILPQEIKNISERLRILAQQEAVIIPESHNRLIYPQTWIVTEGLHHEFTAKLTIPSLGEQFPCTFFTSDPKSKTHDAQCIVSDSGGIVTIKRFYSTDEINCLYWGQRSGKTIAGEYYCYREKDHYGGGPIFWSAKVQ